MNSPPFKKLLKIAKCSEYTPNFEVLGSPHLYKLLLQLLEREILSCCLKIVSFSLSHIFLYTVFKR
jgi:hypothetical protein